MRNKKLEKMLNRVVRYSPALGARYGAATAQQIGCEVEAMYTEGEPITPHNLLARARDPECVLHALFTWDTEQAAEKYRLFEARQILNHLQVVVMEGAHEVTQRALYSLSILDRDAEDDPQRRYFSVSEVRGNEEMQAQVRTQAIKELRNWCLKYRVWDWQEVERVTQLVADCVEDAV